MNIDQLLAIRTFFFFYVLDRSYCYFIREYGNVGSVDEPDDYIEDSLMMGWGPYESDPDCEAVHFEGKTDKTVVVLGGSMKHVLGHTGESRASFNSSTPFLIRYLYKELGIEGASYSMRAYADLPDAGGDAIRRAILETQYCHPPMQKLEFVAKRLLFWDAQAAPGASIDSGRGPEEVCVLLGTPLYVALAD